jgi:hypothetical protein
VITIGWRNASKTRGVDDGRDTTIYQAKTEKNGGVERASDRNFGGRGRKTRLDEKRSKKCGERSWKRFGIEGNTSKGFLSPGGARLRACDRVRVEMG